MNRRNALGNIAAGLGLILAPRNCVQLIKESTDFKLEHIAEEASRYSRSTKESLLPALHRLQSPDISALVINEHNTITKINQEYSGKNIENLLQNNVVISKPDSIFMNSFYRQMPLEIVQLIKDNLNYIIFTEIKQTELDGFISGYYIYPGVALIDRIAEFMYIPSYIAHEAGHATVPFEASTLESEGKANKIELEVLKHQLSDNASLQSTLSFVQERSDLVQYLVQSRFKENLANVIPLNSILSDVLLKAKIDTTVLENIANRTDIFGEYTLVPYNNGWDKTKVAYSQELHFAAKYALIARQGENLEERAASIWSLYDVVLSKEHFNLERINAVLALEHLCRDCLEVELYSNEFPGGTDAIVKVPGNKDRMNIPIRDFKHEQSYWKDMEYAYAKQIPIFQGMYKYFHQDL